MWNKSQAALTTFNGDTSSSRCEEDWIVGARIYDRSHILFTF